MKVLAAMLAAASFDAGSTAKHGIDLLKLIDLEKDKVDRPWTFEEGKLVSAGRPFSRIQIPYIPPEEYEIHAVVEARTHGNLLNMGLAVGERQFMLILDGNAGGVSSGLDLVDGRSFYINETTVKGPLSEPKKQVEVAISVRKERIAVRVGDKTVIDWKADYARLSLYTSWKMPDSNTLFLGAWSNTVVYHKLHLKPLSPGGRKLR
jgi:hypothetical protein